MLGLLSYALKQVIIELCQEKSSNHEKHGWNFYSQAVFLQPPIRPSIQYLRIIHSEMFHFSAISEMVM